MGGKVFFPSELRAKAERAAPRRLTVPAHCGDRPPDLAGLLARVRDRAGLVCQITDAIDEEVLAPAGAATQQELRATYARQETLRQGMKLRTLPANAARCLIPDRAARPRALAEGWIAAAGLRLFEDEPAIDPGLPALDIVVLAPHLARASRATRLAMGALAVHDGLAGLPDRPASRPVP